MKKKIFIVLLVFICRTSISNAQWLYFTSPDTYVGIPWWDPLGTLKDVAFISNDTGMYSYEKHVSPSTGWIVKVNYTTNALQTWNTVYSGIDIVLHSNAIHTVKNKNTFYHVRNWVGIVMIDKTDNGGASWITASATNGGYKDFSAPDTSIYFLLYQGDPLNYFIEKYENGNFIAKFDSFPMQYPNIMFFPDTTTGYIAASATALGPNHIIMKSITGGTNWSTVFTDTSFNIRKMYFVSSNIGYAIGDSGKAIKTIDGGANWQYLNTNVNINLKWTYFINDSLGFACGDSGVVIRTTNGGITWSQDYTGTIAPFRKIFFVNDSIGFALAGGSLYKTNLNLQTGIWQPYNLNQSFLETFPNPTTGKCNVTIPDEFQHEKKLTLNIYDNKGILIQQLPVQMNEGKIKLNLEAEAKGIYNVTLSNGKKSYNGKIVFE